MFCAQAQALSHMDLGSKISGVAITSQQWPDMFVTSPLSPLLCPVTNLHQIVACVPPSNLRLALLLEIGLFDL